MKEKNNTLGETIINGKKLNLDAANIEDLEKSLKEIERAKEKAIKSFNEIVEEIKNN